MWQQQGGEAGRDQRADRPATLHQAVDEAAAADQPRIVRGGIDLGQVGGVDPLLRIAQAGHRTHQHQRHLAHAGAQRGQCRAQGRAADGDDDAAAATDPVHQRADGEGDDGPAQGYPGGEFGLLGFAPVEVPTHHRQQGAEQDEVVDGEHPGEEGDPGGVADISGRQRLRFPGSRGGFRVERAGGREGHGPVPVGWALSAGAAGAAGSRRRSRPWWRSAPRRDPGYARSGVRASAAPAAAPRHRGGW